MQRQSPDLLLAGGSSTFETWGCFVQAGRGVRVKVRRVETKNEANVFLISSKTETHLLAETSSTDAASDARVAAYQNLPGSAVVGQVIFVGVSHRLENMEIYLCPKS